MPEEKAGLISTALELVQPSFLSGYTLPRWIRLLRSNDWAVDGKYIPRAVLATIGALATSALKTFEPEIELDAEAEEIWRKPCFILGLGRSGTTHLFNILAQTGAFAFPARLDCYNPHTFLLLRRIGLHRLLATVPRKKREMDNVETGWLSPEEDRVALQVLTESCRVLSPFPRHRNFVTTSLSPYGDSPDAKKAFCDSLRHFSKKLVCLHRRPLLFKSPSHTSAIPEILSVFPEARFITILRNPFDQFASLAALHRNPKRGFFVLQAPRRIEDEEMLEGIRSVITRYLESRPAIAGSRLIEIRYETLVANPESALQEIQSRFGLLADRMDRTQLARPYVRNTHAEIPEAVKIKLRKVYQPCIDAGLFDPEELT